MGLGALGLEERIASWKRSLFSLGGQWGRGARAQKGSGDASIRLVVRETGGVWFQLMTRFNFKLFIILCFAVVPFGSLCWWPLGEVEESRTGPFVEQNSAGNAPQAAEEG